MNKQLNVISLIFCVIGVLFWAYQSFRDFDTCNNMGGPYYCEQWGIEAPIEIIGICLVVISIAYMLFVNNQTSSEEE